LRQFKDFVFSYVLVANLVDQLDDAFASSVVAEHGSYQQRLDVGDLNAVVDIS
jgi:hypothetical protein